MNKRFVIIFLTYLSTSLLSNGFAQTNNSIQTTSFDLIVEKSILNKSLWNQPYRFEDKSYKTLTVKLFIKKTNAKNESLDFNLFALINESKKIRIRPSGVYIQKGEKRKYLKSKPLNKNYNVFKETSLEGFEDIELKTYKINFLGLKKKNIKASVKSLKKLTFKAKKATYYLDFPVLEGFTYGKIYYNGKPIGFAAVK